MVRDDTGWVLRMYVHARRAYTKTICIVIRMPFGRQGEWQIFVPNSTTNPPALGGPEAHIEQDRDNDERRRTKDNHD